MFISCVFPFTLSTFKPQICLKTNNSFYTYLVSYGVNYAYIFSHSHTFAEYKEILFGGNDSNLLVNISCYC